MKLIASAIGFVFAWAPGWVVSLTLHLTAVVLLALVSLEDTPRSGRELQVYWTSSDHSDMELVHFASPFDDILTDAKESVAPESLAGVDSAALSAAISLAADVSIEESLSPRAAQNGLPEFGGTELRSSGKTSKKGAEFYGLQAEGNAFVFIVDRSNSMVGQRLLEAKMELMYALRRLSPDQSFYVIFFAGESEFMRLAPHLDPESKPVLATVENLTKVESWVASVNVQPWTNPFDAVKFALTLEPDGIFLLTDGEFTDKGRTIRYLHNRNFVKDPGEPRRPRIIVNCIGFHSRDGEKALQSIAHDFGGNYRFVPPPKIVIRQR